MTTLRWGLFAAGAIARAFATGLQQTNSGKVVAVAARNGDDASTFATKFDIPRAHEGYDALIADPSVDAIYLSTPHNHHAAVSYTHLRAHETPEHVGWRRMLLKK